MTLPDLLWQILDLPVAIVRRVFLLHHWHYYTEHHRVCTQCGQEQAKIAFRDNTELVWEITEIGSASHHPCSR